MPSVNPFVFSLSKRLVRFLKDKFEEYLVSKLAPLDKAQEAIFESLQGQAGSNLMTEEEFDQLKKSLDDANIEVKQPKLQCDLGDVETLTLVLTRFYKNHNQSKLDESKSLAVKYAASWQKLDKAMKERYPESKGLLEFCPLQSRQNAWEVNPFAYLSAIFIAAIITAFLIHFGSPKLNVKSTKGVDLFLLSVLCVGILTMKAETPWLNSLVFSTAGVHLAWIYTRNRNR